MPQEPGKPVPPSKPSFLREGFREWGRKWERRKLRKQTAQQGGERTEALARLGRKACEVGIDLSDFGELRGQIRTLEARTAELAATTDKLKGEQAALEEKRRAESARFDAQRKAIDDLKRPVDAGLRDATQKQSAQEREIKRIEGRLAAIAGERAALERQAAAAPGQAAPAADQTKLQQILAEHSQLSVELPRAKEALQALAPEISKLTAESQRYAHEITKIEAERKATLAQIDQTLTRLRGELQATGQQTAAATQELHNRFVQLGQGLYEKKKDEPKLAELVHEVVAVEQKLGGTAASLRASLAETQAMPRGTMAKFALALLGTPLLIVGLIYGGYLAWDRLRPDVRVETPKPVNRYLQHPLKDHAAYALANQLAEAKSEQEVADRLRDALRKIHVGIYTPDGRQILAGAERSQNDLFLYDFQVKILAHAFFLRNGMPMANHTRMLGKALLELEQPSELEPVLNGAIVQRYREAQQKPDDPMSFIVLLTDGLARQQVEPYSLNETHRYERVDVDPIQSLLIMLDFFTRPPPPKSPASTGLKWFPSFVTKAYAQGPCDGILGDEGQGYYGRGTDIFTELAQNIPGLAGKAVGFVGNVTGIGGAIADLLILYGMNIKLTPEPYTVHLVHDADDSDMMFVQALVTFDAQGVPDEVLKCGWLAGKQMPANGPLKDVELTWDFFPKLPPYLEMSSEMLRGPNPRIVATAGGLRTNTNEAGTSSFLITVKQCPDKRGMILGQDYLAKVTARYVTKSIPTPGLLGFGLILKLGPGAIEYLMGGRNGYVRFRAEWHKKKPPPKQY
jgi:predicted  nucleic acid-binding Zn-ribbon protein